MTDEKIIEEIQYNILLEEFQASLDRYKSICGKNRKILTIEVKELSEFKGLGYLY